MESENLQMVLKLLRKCFLLIPENNLEENYFYCWILKLYLKVRELGNTSITDKL